MTSSWPGGASSARAQPVQSVGRALDLLEVLTVHDEIGLAELARRAGLPASTVHRLLATLVQRGWVTQSAHSGRYLLSYRVLRLAERLQRRTAQLRATVRPYLERARKVSGASANLVVLQDGHVLFLDQLHGTHRARAVCEPGRSVPAHSSGSGKALLAQKRQEDLEALLASEPFPRFTERTITTAAEMRAELARIREDGFAIDEGEYRAGVTCVAAPVFDPLGQAVAAISVSGPPSRMREIGLRELGEFLVILTGELAAELAGEDA